MNQAYLLTVLGLGAVLSFFVLWFIFKKLTNEFKSLEEAQKASVESHYLATSLNAVGLGLGIFLVFFMASWGELFITLGMIFVLLSIVAYVGFEWVAKHDDKEIARLQENIRIDGVAQLEEITRIEGEIQQEVITRLIPAVEKGSIQAGGTNDLRLPNRLNLKDGYIEMTYDPKQKDASKPA